MTLMHTPLDALHRELGAKMVPFAGYDMPVQYATGIIKEHLHTRAGAGLFDVSHMGQLLLEGDGSPALLESLVPVDIQCLELHQQTYALLTNDRGGVLDDLIITRWGDEKFFLVVNAACKLQDIAHIQSHLNGQTLSVMSDQALLALQGPSAREIMQSLCPGSESLVFMHGSPLRIADVDAYVTCSGYTGEDGFEISVPASAAEKVARLLLADSRVLPVGLGARDSLRLEAGLCLYGHELSEEIGPVQAGLLWSVSKSRRPEGERPGGFAGADTIFEQIQNKPALCRVGLKGDDKRPMREDQVVVDPISEKEIGRICSAGYGASVGGPIAMAYIDREFSQPGTNLEVMVRSKRVSVAVVKMPFNPARYYRG